MRPLRLLLYLTLCGACPVDAWAADLDKIDRTIKKEPVYKGKPAYCLLVFGPEAKFRVWLVVDAAVLYVDRNGNGDLTEPGKRVPAYFRKGDSVGFRPGQIDMPDGKTKYYLTQVRKDEDGCDMCIRLQHRDYTRAGFDGPGKLCFADRARDAPIIHFLGPLTLQRFEPQAGSVSSHLKAQPLERGQVNDLAFSLGTPGLGSGTFAKYPCDQPASAEIRFGNGKTITASLEHDN
jgi:hypothetical protein